MAAPARRAARPAARERVVQDVEIPVEHLPEFLAWFDARGRDAPGVAVPAAAARRRPDAWPPLPADARARPTSTSASGARSTSAPARGRRREPRDRGQGRPSSAATSRSTPTRTTTERPSTRSTAATHLPAVKQRYDPDGRLHHPLRQGGATTMTTCTTRAHDHRSPTRSRCSSSTDCPCRFTAYDGSSAGPADAPVRMHLANRARPDLPAHRPGRPGHGARLRAGRPRASRACHPGDPYDALRLLMSRPDASGGRRRPRPLRLVRALGSANLVPPPPPPQEALPRWRRVARGPSPLPWAATPRRSTTTTTCRTGSTRWCSARR